MADRLALLEEEAAAEAEEEEEIDLAAEEVGSSDGSGDADDDEDDDEDDDVEVLDAGPYDVHADAHDDEPYDNDDEPDLDGADDSAGPATTYEEEAKARQAGSAGASATGRDDDTETSTAPDAEAENAAGEPRSTVLSEAMPRDAALHEAPAGLHESAETAAAGSSEAPGPAATGQEGAQASTAASDNEDSVPAADDHNQPDYYTPVAAGADAGEADEADTDEETGDDRGGARRTGRPPAGRRRRGGRSRRGRPRDGATSGDDDTDSVDQVGNEDALEELPSRPRRSRRSYKIQEVVKRRQVLLIQVVKEERGNKGAALTTYLSLAGRYTVLMPNTARGGGISRKITTPQDRKRLKAIANELDVPEGMGLIIRTAGAARTKQEIRRDFEYLLRLWESVRELTLQSTAPALVYEEGDLIKRSIRDLYNKDVDQVVVAGEEAFRGAKSFMRMLMPSHAKNVIQYEDPEPLFTRHGIERQLNAMFSPYVHLPSGGYLVINQTEALVAIDVNSGRSTREFSIEETALNTNLEASDEIARQLKLRDLAGLIVIDYIDMEERRNNRNVERRIREALKDDRARIQIGRISPFGLLEMSRQRLRTGVLEGSTTQCAHCQGTGIIRSVESVALGVLRGLEDAVMAGARTSLIANTTAEVALYILNNKRDFVVAMEKRLGMPVVIQSSPKMAGANFTIEKGEVAPLITRAAPKLDAVSVDWGFDENDGEVTEAAEEPSDVIEAVRSDDADKGEGEGRSRRRRRRRGGRRSEEGSASDGSESVEHADASDESDDDDDSDEVRSAGPEDDESGDEKSGRRRRRGRRGGRRNRGRNRDGEEGREDAHVASGDNGYADDEDGEPDDATTGSKDGPPRGAAGEHHAANDDEPDADDPAAAASLAQPFATTIESGTPEREHNSHDASSPIPEATATEDIALGKPPLDETATPVTIATQPLEDESGSEAALIAGADADSSRRPRGEPVSSEPRIARITVAPDGPPSAEESSTDDEVVDTGETGDKPTRRGWWQRKLLGDA
ncbi:MAG: Rne/Rng family ribonuclease [Alphaproteobacteria bacterium]|nr:Rne/Rng family ribonuclease [Alphaproteobacteria bacterium]